MRKKRLLWNTLSSLVFLVISMICGFITPRLILEHYGSEVNGLVDSITQCLRIIVFLEFGVGAVVQAALYKPLAEDNKEEISRIVRSANRYFRIIAIALLIYVVALLFFYPKFQSGKFDFRTIDLLIIALSLNLFTQYFFGIVDKILLIADQKGYVIYTTQTIAIILSTVLTSLMIINGADILLVEVVASIVFVLRPVVFHLYVRKNYRIDRKIQYDHEPIKQKWDGLAQHVSATILESTDSVVLTIFSTLSNVSIYAVYFLVVNGIRQLMKSATNGIQSLLGEIIAKNEKKNLEDIFDWFEFVLHTGATIAWTCAIVLIVPFVKIYTTGINDANYVVPEFALLICLAYSFETIRLCYYVPVLSAGHFKETRSNFIITASINIFFFFLSVNRFGLIGVAIGTMVAMLYQTIWMAIYTYKNILDSTPKRFFIRSFEDIVLFFIIYFSSRVITINNDSYIRWIISAVEVLSIAIFETGVFYLIFERARLMKALAKISRKIKRRQ